MTFGNSGIEVTRAVHGATETDKAIKASRVLFGGEVADLEAEQIEDVFGDVPSIDIDSAELSKATVVSLLAASGLARSKGEARRLIQGGGIYLNSLRTTDVQARVDRDSCLHGRFLVLRKGAKNYRLVRVVGHRE